MKRIYPLRQTEEKKADVEWERFSNFNRLLNTEPVKDGTAGTKDAREYDEVHRRAVQSGNAVEWTRAKPTEQLPLSLGSVLLNGAKIPKRPKPENFVSTVNRYNNRKKIRKYMGRVQNGRYLWMVFATPFSAKSEQAWQSKTCMQSCKKVQRKMPKWQTTSTTWSATRFDWNSLQISWRSNCTDSWHRIDVSTSASSRTG